MTRALALETSSRSGSVAVVQDGRVLAEESFPHGLQHAAQIVPIIDRLTRAQDWRPRDLDELYVSTGPGSFTGLRIGITLGKTMALATGVKLVAVPTLRVLVENAPPEAQHVVLVLDAKRNQIFTARYERSDATWLERQSPQVSTLQVMLASAPRPVYLLGEGIPFHEKFIPRDDPQIIVIPAELWRPRASVVAKLGYVLARAGKFADPDRLVPTYIRPPEAQEKWEKQNVMT